MDVCLRHLSLCIRSLSGLDQRGGCSRDGRRHHRLLAQTAAPTTGRSGSTSAATQTRRPSRHRRRRRRAGREQANCARAVHLRQRAIGLAWSPATDDETASLPAFAPAIADGECLYHWVELLYEGAVVDRHLAARVDGGRASLPVPSAEPDGDGSESTLWVSRRAHDLVRLANEVDPDCSDFDDYFAGSGIELRYGIGPLRRTGRRQLVVRAAPGGAALAFLCRRARAAWILRPAVWPSKTHTSAKRAAQAGSDLQHFDERRRAESSPPSLYTGSGLKTKVF